MSNELELRRAGARLFKLRTTRAWTQADYALREDLEAPLIVEIGDLAHRVIDDWYSKDADYHAEYGTDFDARIRKVLSESSGFFEVSLEEILSNYGLSLSHVFDAEELLCEQARALGDESRAARLAGFWATAKRGKRF